MTWTLTDIVVRFGIPQETILLLLMFPIVATFIAFLWQVVGVRAFGIYTPAIVAIIFYLTSGRATAGGPFTITDLLIDVRYGIVIYVSVILIAMALRSVFQRVRLLYLARVALTMTLVSFAMLAILMVSALFRRTGFASVYPFALLVLVIIAEKFVAVQVEKGTREALLMAGKTLAVALCGYAILAWPALIQAVARHPWSVLFVIPINIAIGRWRGLRLTEYARFHAVLKAAKRR